MSSRARLLPYPVADASEAWVAPEAILEDQAANAGGSAQPDPRAAAYDRGVAEGRRLAAEAQAALVTDLARQLRQALSQVDAVRDDLLAQSEAQLVTAALAIARCVLRRESLADPTLLRQLAASAVSHVRGAAQVRVVAHPLDLETIRPGRETGGSVQYLADDRSARGTCRVESAYGEVEAGIDAQLLEIERALRDGDVVVIGDPP